MPTLQPADIERIVTDIQASSVTNKEHYFAKTYAEFKEAYPYLYNVACTTSLNMDTLKFMLRMISKVDDKKTSSHEASVQVGQRLYDQYVEPTITKKT